MSNTKRPSLQRQETRKTKEARQAALDSGVRITFDGKVYEVRVGDVTPSLARRFRREYGVPFMAVLEEELAGQPDIDSIAAVIWLARLMGGEDDLSFDDVALSYADLDDLDIEEAGPAPQDGNPEA